MLFSTMEHAMKIPQKPIERYGYSTLPCQPPGFAVHTPHQMASCEASIASYNSSTSSQKRDRGDQDETNDGEYHRSSQAASVYYEESPVISALPQKKARSRTYEAPRVVKPSLLTAMGTLAASGASNVIGGSSVPVRRRLSGGHLEEFIGTFDQSMDTDTSDSRPRSMSF